MNFAACPASFVPPELLVRLSSSLEEGGHRSMSCLYKLYESSFCDNIIHQIIVSCLCNNFIRLNQSAVFL